MMKTVDSKSGSIRPVIWDALAQCIVLLDQTALPLREQELECLDTTTLVDAIKRLVVRGAPALGVVGAYGVALAMREASDKGWTDAKLSEAIDLIRNARPTAVNLAKCVDIVQPFVPEGLAKVLSVASELAEEDEKANRKLSERGADWLLNNIGDRPLRAVTHCNTGSLATSTWGTAFGILRELHLRGRLEMVYVNETRPLLQGSRLTAWELKKARMPFVVQVDGAAASTITGGLVDFATVGADRIARNGDTANKIGSLAVALACGEAGIPFLVAAPSSTIDLTHLTGQGIEIELRDNSEVVEYVGHLVAPEDSQAFNPAFDVTPAAFIDAVVTEIGVALPKHGETVERLVRK